jgi:hypothetical protein
MKAWYAKVSPNRHRLFAGRHYGDVTLVDGEIVVRTRRGHTVLQTATEALMFVRLRNGLLLQVLALDPDENTHVFEFRPRRHDDGRALADALR